MAYRLKKGRIGAKAVRRLGFEQIDRALAVLGSDTVSPEGVHECRKVVKRVRAVLRLFEPKIKPKTFKACYRGIGEAADLLAGARESHVLQETISKLETRFGPVEALPLAPLKVHLEKRAHEHPHAVDVALTERLKERFEEEKRRLSALQFKGRGFSVLEPGLARTYRLARQNHKRAESAPTDENLHDLRKAVQWHWRQLALLAAAWPEQFSVHIAACKQLAEILGDDHDLSMLLVELEPFLGTDIGDVAAIRALALRRQDELRHQAYPMCARLFAERPTAFVRRIRSYWRAKGKMPAPLADAPAGSLTVSQLNGGRKAAAAPRLVAKPAKAERSQQSQ